MNRKKIREVIVKVFITLGIIVTVLFVIWGKFQYSYERNEQLKEIKKQNAEDWINNKYDY